MGGIVKGFLGSALLIGIALSGLVFGQDTHPSKNLATASTEIPSFKIGTTLDNLRAAYVDEVTAQSVYAEYARKADEEGYHQVASMFRAVQRAEEVHAANYANVLKPKGNLPQVDVQTPAVKSTRENLEAAVASEDFNKDVRYPQFIQQAKKERNKEAEQAFNYSKVVESEHAAIYDQALNDLDSYKGGNLRFLVCPHCGKTTVAMHNPKCPLCSTPREQFLTVN